MAHTKRVPKAKAPQHPTIRGDGWSNVTSGFGVLGKDKRLGQSYGIDFLSQEQCEQLWRGDDIIARCVETLPNEMMREGFETCIEDDKDLAEEMDHDARRLNVAEKFTKGAEYGRAYGGGGLLIGANDGTTNLERPLNEDAIQSIDFLTELTPRELVAKTYFSDIRKERYGEVATYWLVPIGTPQGTPVTQMQVIHESRVIRFGGNSTSRLARFNGINPGWDDSILIRIAQIVSDFQASWQGAGILLQDFSTPVLKIKGLAAAVAGRNPNNTSIAQRAAALELCRSIARVALVDADQEDYARHTTPVTGLAEMLDKFMLRLAAAAEMPVSLLMGQAPAGLNATGDADVRWFFNQVAAKRRRRIVPQLRRLLTLMFKAKNGPAKGQEPENWDISFPALWQLTEAEEADRRLKIAQADQIYINAQVVTPAEVAKSRFSDEFSGETHIDVDLRDELLDDPEHMQSQLGKPSEHEQAMNEATLKQAQNVAKAPPGGKPPPIKKG